MGVGRRVQESVVSNWILISERMPTREETNGHAHVLAVDERGTHWIWDYVRDIILAVPTNPDEVLS